MQLFYTLSSKLTLASLALGLCLLAGTSVAQGQEQDSTGGDPARNHSGGSASSPKKRDRNPTPNPDSQHPPEGYKIGVDDSLFISVWKEPDLSSQVTVRPDGVITLPLINDVPVVGLTPKELQNLLTEKLKQFVNEPQVTVVVRDIRSRKVFLVGQVGKQGSIPLSGNMTMMELIASAGGLGPFAKSESIYILRTRDGHQTKIPFHYKKTLQGKSPDVVLEPGDMIVVP